MSSEDCKLEYNPPLARAQLICELLAFVLCLMVTGCQMGLLDYYFVIYGDEKLWLCWIIGDVLVLAVMCWIFHFAIQYSRRCLRQPCKDEANLKYAFIVWLVYSIILSGKIATFFPIFSNQLLPTDLTAGAQEKRTVWGPVALKLILGLSAVIFLLLVLSHHYNRLNNPRAMYLSYLSSSISIDLLDSVLFLELLIQPTLQARLSDHQALKISILVFACINFVLPTFSLFKLRYKKGLPQWVPLPYEKLYSLFYFLFVNVPYFIIRSYLWRKQEHDVSIFMVKNAIMIALGIRDVWVGYLIWREKKALRAHQAAGGQDPYGDGQQRAGSADRLR